MASSLRDSASVQRANVGACMNIWSCSMYTVLWRKIGLFWKLSSYFKERSLTLSKKWQNFSHRCREIRKLKLYDDVNCKDRRDSPMRKDVKRAKTVLETRLNKDPFHFFLKICKDPN